MTLPNDPTTDPDPRLPVETATSEAATAATTRSIRPPSTELLQTVNAAARASRTPMWRKLLRDPQALITIIILVIIFTLGALAPLIAPFGANEANLRMVNAPVGAPGYLLGADESGRDILSRLLYSIQTAAISALIGTGVALVVGVTAGLVGGYFGRTTFMK